MRVVSEAEQPPWWRRALDFADENRLWAAFAVMTACAAAGYVCGYRDAARDRER